MRSIAKIWFWPSCPLSHRKPLHPGIHSRNETFDDSILKKLYTSFSITKTTHIFLDPTKFRIYKGVSV